MITSIRVTDKTKNRLKELSNMHSKTSIDIFLEYLLDYLDRNDIDLNFDVKNDVYNTLKINQIKFDKFSDELFKNEERIIKILRRFELDYFKQITEINNPVVKEVITNSVNNFDSNLYDELISKIAVEESAVTGRKKYIVNITDEEYLNLVNNAR